MNLAWQFVVVLLRLSAIAIMVIWWIGMFEWSQDYKAERGVHPTPWAGVLFMVHAYKNRTESMPARKGEQMVALLALAAGLVAVAVAIIAVPSLDLLVKATIGATVACCAVCALARWSNRLSNGRV